MKQFVSHIITKRWVIATAFLLIAFFGYYAWKQLTVEAYPDIADVSSQIVTQVPGLAAEEMEQQITIPIEQAINGLPGMEVMRSKTTFGLSMVTIVFKDGVDDYWARARIQERLADLSLPYGAAPGLDPLTSPTGEIFRYILESNTQDLRKLTELQNFVIIPKIKQVAGVADVTNFGGITTQFQVELDPKKLDQYEVSLSEVTSKIEANNANAGGSMMNRGDQSYVIRGIGLVKSLDDLANIVVKSVNGNRIYMRDLGQVKLGNLARKGALGYSDKRGANYSDNIEGIVLLLKHENPSKVLAGVNAAVEELNRKILPKDVKIHVVLDRTSLVDNTLHTVSKTLLEGMVLVILVLILFLGSWRGALLVAITIPLSLLIAFILMHFTDIPANLLSLGAIDFGIIVDGAIVMLETILKKREEKPGVQLAKLSLAARIAEVAKPIFFATIIIITAYLPLFAFERVERKLFTPMAYTVGYALLGALAVSLLLIPGLAYMIYRKPQKVYHNKWLEKLTALYHQRIKKIMLRPKQIFVPLALVLLATGLLTASVGKDFLPTLDEGSIWLQVSLPPGITVEKSKEMSDSLRARTLKYEEISYVMVQAGRNDDGTDAWTPSHFEVSVGLKPYKTWKWGKTKADLINELAAEYATMPGYNVAFSQPMIDGVMDKIAGAHSELVVKLFGDDLKETRRTAEDLITTLKGVAGAVDLAIDQEPPLPQLQIIVDRDKIAQYGLNISDVTDLIQIAIGGKPVSQVYQGIKVYDITCQYPEHERSSPETIGNLMLYPDNGARIPLSQVATIKLNTGESTISRERNSRQLTVRLNVRGRDLGAFLTEAQQAIAQKLKYDPQKIKLQWGGQFENQHRAYSRLAVIVPLTLAIIFILLYSTFGSFGQAGLLIGIVPLALFGGMLALNFRGMTLNVSSAVGFIALFGVAIQNGVLMLSQFNVLRKNGMPLKKAVIEGAFSRFRPVLMTATVAILGLLPASLATGIGSDVQRPLATVIVYGLLFSTLLTLFMLPPLYYLLERGKQHKGGPGSSGDHTQLETNS
ncbi:CusA/CzcA family heavy metal efflux RND transporter [Sphingobacterium sp. DR205]|uniref:efflux RND transporter permease subunit n=1 Tax=Sphingobacterium sp. DR205 TaxID=2713573 RepID=UPI0013E46EE1|nr:CusA/CzcA family heavy metal efflux RND transporter [Sphingobacterium sp. DR205]QIH32567.1 efflux RND transporter permease subunit [Sphingobacterium sp. DR205]